jgi:hypothetical protein
MDMPPPEQPPDAAGIVIVDIGGDAGAAVIYTSSEMVGEEIAPRVPSGTAPTPRCGSGKGPELQRPRPYSGRFGPGATS